MNDYIILHTASVAREFGFYSSEEPDYSIFKKRYKASFDDKKLIIEITDNNFVMFMSKIPSNKIDKSGRKFFYGLLAKGEIGNNEIVNTTKKLAYAFIDDIDTLSSEFDKIFTSDYLSSLDNKRNSEDTQSKIFANLVNISKGLKEVPSSSEQVENGIIFIDTNGKYDFLSYLNQLSIHTTKGLTIIFSTDCIYDSTLSNLENNISTPAQGLIMTIQNKTDMDKILKKNSNSDQTKSPNGSKSKRRTIMWIFLISLIANVILIIYLISLKTSVTNLENVIIQKDSSLNGAKEEICLLKNAKNNDNVVLDVEKFINDGYIRTYKNTADSISRYQYTFKVFSSDTIGIYCDDKQIFRGNPKLLANNELQLILADFTQKIQPYISTTVQTKEKRKKK